MTGEDHAQRPGSRTTFPRDLCEEALAHAIGNQVEQAYRREQAVEKRRVLMQAWADYVGGGIVIPMRRAL
jgi:hypothetical protein